MGDSFTNFLLVTLISLIDFIGKLFYDKIEAFAQKIEKILLNDVSSGKDITQLQEDVKEHEKRISDLEK